MNAEMFEKILKERKASLCVSESTNLHRRFL